jgi:hypothetical protein
LAQRGEDSMASKPKVEEKKKEEKPQSGVSL